MTRAWLDSIALGGSGFLGLRFELVEWDSKVFQYPVLHLVSHQLHGATEKDVKRWGHELSELAKSNRLMLTARVDSDDLHLRATLQLLNLQALEWTLHPKIDLRETARTFVHHFESRSATEGDFGQIVLEASKAFRVSRFHRDINVSRVDADKRFENWIATSSSDPRKDITVFLEPGTGVPVAFFLHRRDGDDVFLELTAIFENFRGLGLALRIWETFLADQRVKNVRTVSTNISAENLAVIGIYPKLGFTFSRSSVAFHGHFGLNAKA